MAGSFRSTNNDPIDIGELASLNEDISDDFLEQLQNKLATEANVQQSAPQMNENDDSTLFEETPAVQETVQPAEIAAPEEQKPAEQTPVTDTAEAKAAEEENKDNVQVNQSFDDNFIKKYKAKLNKKAQDALQSGKSVNGQATTKYIQDQELEAEEEPIETVSDGNITERPLTPQVKEYNESLDFLDGNVKYSKYVIYIEPNNVDFIDGLTVKERKNLINNILRQQDDISITKQRFSLLQTVIRQIIIAVLTISVSIPLVYYVINASLEATIDNHRRSQVNWQVLYKEHGKIHNMN